MELKINGMKCKNCAISIEQKVKEIKNVNKVKVDLNKGLIEIDTKDNNIEEIRKVINELGYQTPNKELLKKRKYLDYLTFISIITLLLILYGKFNIDGLIPNHNDIGLGLAIIMGFIASISTCLALTGGIVMSLSSQIENNNHNFGKVISPQIFFQLGRVLGFFLLGGILGIIGKSIEYSLGFTGYLTILISIILIYIGLQFWGFIPQKMILGFGIPNIILKLGSRFKKINSNIKSLSLGAFTFFLPCGFTQSMQLVAVSSGSFIYGGLIMMLFAIGTLPILLSIGIGSNYYKSKNYPFLNKFIGTIIIVFGLYSINSGIILSGIDKNSLNNETTYETKMDGIQNIEINIDYSFSPSVINLKHQIPVKLTINANHVSGCSDELIIPSLGFSTGKMKNGDKITFEFIPKEKGTIPFSCWMGMIRGKFIVE